MAGHVFVVPGDITQLSADAIVCSTDCEFGTWGLMHEAFRRRVPAFAAQFRRLARTAPRPVRPGSAFWLPLRGRRGPAGVVVTPVAGWADLSLPDCARVAVTASLSEAAARLEALGRRPPFRIALPAFLAGHGGGWNRLLAAATPQLEEAEKFVRDHDVDVAFVTHDDSAYQAWTTARRSARRRLGRRPRVPALPADLVDALRAGECVVFVGAGLSSGAGLKGWRALVGALADALEIPEASRGGDTDFFLDLAQWYRDEGREPPLEKWVRRAFRASRSGVLPTLAHCLIARLPVRFYVTTNYDELIETALEASRRYPVRVVSDRDVARTGGDEGCYVVKFHGCAVAGGDIVLSRDDYDGLFERRPALALLLEGLLLNRSFLFLGYSLRDPDFRQIHRRVWAMLCEARRPAFATVLGQANEHRRRQWRRQGLELVPVPGRSQAEQSRALDRMLDALLEAVSGMERRLLGRERPVSRETALAKQWDRLGDLARQVVKGCQRIGRADRGEVLATASVIRLLAGLGWRGDRPGEAAAALQRIAGHRSLRRVERLSLLGAALEVAEDERRAASLRARIAKLEGEPGRQRRAAAAAGGRRGRSRSKARR